MLRKQALNSDAVRTGQRKKLLRPTQLYEALRARGGKAGPVAPSLPVRCHPYLERGVSLPRDSPRRCFRSRLNAHRVEQLKDNHTKRGRDDLWPAPGISPIRLLESGPVVSRSGFLHQPER